MLVAAGVTVLAVLGAGLWVGSQALYARSFNSWLTATEAAEDTMEAFLADEKEATDQWNRVTNNGANRTDGPFNAWLASVTDAAYIWVATLKVQQHDMEQMTFLPWQGSLATARDDYVDHIEAWIAFMEAISQMDGDGDYDAASKRYGPDIEATFNIAANSAKTAVPTLFVGDLQARVDAEFAN